MSIYRKLFTIIYTVIHFQKRYHVIKNLKDNTDYKNALDKFRTEFPKIFLEGIYDKSILIFSCSEAKNNIPMWAHYAGNHTGFQICFDPSKAFELYTPKGKLVKPSLEKVKYVKRFPKPKDPWRGLRIIAKTKLASWSYEEEWRFIAIPQNLRESGTDKAGLPIFLAPLNLSSIQEITFGHLASDDLISRVKTKCEANIPAVKFWKNNNRGSREPII
jgi:hypothetical protein